MRERFTPRSGLSRDEHAEVAAALLAARGQLRQAATAVAKARAPKLLRHLFQAIAILDGCRGLGAYTADVDHCGLRPSPYDLPRILTSVSSIEAEAWWSTVGRGRA